MINLRGAGQVLFQENALTGLLFIVGIAWANPLIGLAAVIGLVLSTLTGMLLKFDHTTLEKGLCGYNGILIGIALAIFLPNNFTMWLLLILAASTCVFVAKIKWLNPPLTFPFVITSWIILYATKFSSNHSTSPIVLADVNFYFHGILKGLSQIFLIDNSVTGALFLIGLAISSLRAAIWSLIGSVLGLFLAIILGLDLYKASIGLYGYSAAITAIAIACAFSKPSLKTSLYCIFGIVLTVFIQIGLGLILTPLHLPIFAAPFIFAVWILLWIKKGLVKEALD